MFVSMQWLREFVPYEGDVKTLADRLTMQGQIGRASCRERVS
jgi:phenylalanyl-tRNA synthetase beta chain